MQIDTPEHSILNSDADTRAGNYFVSNYPPYSFWTPDHVGDAYAALERAPAPGTPLGVYLHIPFCRKRCTSATSRSIPTRIRREIESYLDAAVAGAAGSTPQKPFIGGRKPKFIYFGGGTPSYISTRQLTRLVDAMKRLLPWDEAEEITFECEPGTLTEGKLRGHQGNRRHAPQPGHRELRRPDPADQRTRARLEGDRPRLRVRPLHRIPADQYRPDRRHGGRDRPELARMRPQDHRAELRTASPSTRWRSPTTRRSSRR